MKKCIMYQQSLGLGASQTRYLQATIILYTTLASMYDLCIAHSRLNHHRPSLRRLLLSLRRVCSIAHECCWLLQMYTSSHAVEPGCKLWRRLHSRGILKDSKELPPLEGKNTEVKSSLEASCDTKMQNTVSNR